MALQNLHHLKKEKIDLQATYIIIIIMEPKNFKELVHYICEQTKENPNKLGITKLNKILWFSDLFSYANYGRGITSESYLKRQFGPVPEHILSTLEALDKQGLVTIRENKFHGYVQKQPISLSSDVDTEFMSDGQKKIVDDILKDICDNFGASSISELSHNEVWDMAEEGEEIPLFTAFTGTAGEVCSKDISWAKEEINQLKPV